LEPAGLAAIQAIVVEDRRFRTARGQVDFIKRHIFPGGSLPSITAMLDSITRSTDLRLVHLEDIGRHYVATLAAWRRSLQANRAAALATGVSPSFLRMFDFYFAYCQAGFAERRISDVQLLLAAPRWRDRGALATVAAAVAMNGSRPGDDSAPATSSTSGRPAAGTPTPPATAPAR
jgi:cyclopropane-fatty-acyl-phospholipid synthase